MSWKEIWEKKGAISKNVFSLEDLIAIDGYDAGPGHFQVKDWLLMIDMIEEKLNLKKEQLVCEVCCGAGAFLFPLYRKGYKNLSGIDYSANLINICRKVMPNGDFRVAEAQQIPFATSQFDIVISNSVFHYFPNLNYAEISIKEIVRILKPIGKGAILDINDLDKKDLYESIKIGKLGLEEYQRLHKDHPQMFYEKSWFIDMAKRDNLRYEITDQAIVGYENSKFRFNFYFQRIK